MRGTRGEGKERERREWEGGEGGRTRNSGRHAKHLVSATAFHLSGPCGAHPNTTFPLGHGSGDHAPGDLRQAHSRGGGSTGAWLQDAALSGPSPPGKP